jgi:hypothetical protein
MAMIMEVPIQVFVVMTAIAGSQSKPKQNEVYKIMNRRKFPFNLTEMEHYTRL